MVVSLTTTTFVARARSNRTTVAPVKLVPLMVTPVPPLVGPLFGVTEVTVGAPIKVNAPLRVPEPPAVVTTTSTVPAAWAGVVAVIEVGPFTVKLVAAVPPKVTAVVPLKLVPVIVTLVPPSVGPLFGETEVTVGAAM
jgi:hypothetical protein